MQGKDYDKENVFAKIIRGELPCAKVADSEHAIAFKDLHPQARTHILVVPKGAYRDIADFTLNASAAELGDFWKLALSVAVMENVRDNFRIIANTGERAGQSVPHFHIHILAD